MGQGLLAIDMLAALHGGHGHRCVHVVGDAHRDGVEAVSQCGEHLAVVGEMLHAGKLRIRLVKAVGVHIAEADELHRCVGAHVVKIAEAHAIDPHAGHLELAVEILPAHEGRKSGSGGGEGGVFQKSTA